MRLRKTISVLLILVGFLLAIWGKFTLLAGLPFFITGAILNFLTNRALWLKLLLVVLPVVLWMPAVQGVWYTKNKAASHQDTFIFPKGFVGKVVIAYGLEKGDTVQVINGRRIFRFDTSGVLITQAPVAKGMVDQQFFYEDSAGNLTKLNPYSYFKQDKTKEDSTLVQVFGWHEIGSTGNDASCKYKFMNLIVSNINQLETVDVKFNSWKLYQKIEQQVCVQ
jgi:hypothetical protein